MQEYVFTEIHKKRRVQVSKSLKYEKEVVEKLTYKIYKQSL